MTGQLFATARMPTEREFQSAIQRALDREGYRWCYVRRMKTPDNRWLTGTSSAGFPDLLALRPGYVLAIEVKSATGKPTPAQVEWLSSFHAAGALAWVLSPKDDVQAVARWIARPATAPDHHGFTPLESSPLTLQPKETP